MKLTGLVSMMLRATWWDLYSSCLRSTWPWKRGCFLTGSSGPNCGETTLSTGVQDSEKMKGLNIDLAERRKETKRNPHQPPACIGGETIPCGAPLTQRNRHYKQVIGTDFSFTYVYRRLKWSHPGQTEDEKREAKRRPPMSNGAASPKQPSAI